MAGLPGPKTRQGLIDYCLRRLGAPVIEINVDPDQVEDRIDDAFQFFQDYHFDGVEKVFLKHQITAQDISQNYIDFSNNPLIVSILRVIPITNSNRNMGMFDVQYQMRLNDLYTFTSTSIMHYDIMQKHLALLNFEFNTDPGIEFVRHQGQLHINTNWQTDFPVGSYIIIECYRILDPQSYPDVYNDRWLKAYATELIRRQWGENLMKYSGVALIGGTQLNGGEIYQKALDNLEKLEHEVQESFQLPVNFILG
jgi:hypothetical protein